jgi:AAA family ATPase
MNANQNTTILLPNEIAEETGSPQPKIYTLRLHVCTIRVGPAFIHISQCILCTGAVLRLPKMTETRSFTVRPLSKQPRNDHRDSFRVYLSPSSLTYLRLRAGDLCSIQLNEGIPKTAIAWTALENIQNTVVQTSKALQDCYHIKLGDKITIRKSEGPLEGADIIQLEECSDPDKLANHGSLSAADKSHWEWALEYQLSKCEVLSVGLIFDAEMKGQRRNFKVSRIVMQGATEKTIFRFTGYSKIEIGKNEDSGKRVTPLCLEVHDSGLGGLSDQISKINESLLDFSHEIDAVTMPSFYKFSKGILIYGPKGTGKTSLLQRVQAAGWAKTFVIGSSTLSRSVGDGEAKLRKVFQDAMLSQPSVVVIDQIESVAPKRTSHESSSLAYALCESIDALADAKVLVVAATRHRNDVDESLRTPHRLAIEIELSVPTAVARAEILRAIRGESKQPDDSVLDSISEKTHGYVGADLFALLQLACRKARIRQKTMVAVPLNMEEGSPLVLGQEDESTVSLVISESDVVQAMQEVRPTAMREVFLETPKVRWSDIGGQHSIKRHLQKVVERPLKV